MLTSISNFPPSLISALILAAAVLFLIALTHLLRMAHRLADRTENMWDNLIFHRGIPRALAALAAGVTVHILTRIWLGPQFPLWDQAMRTIARLWTIGAGVMLVNALLDTIHYLYQRLSFARQVPILAFIQVAKLVVFLVALIMAISVLMNRSPTLLVSGLGAMTAILMLVFKDPILGFVAGIQLSANRMLAVGDWLEMPRYQADGDVIEITLTTVKVQNWDRTITTIPTYALISESFKNWRGMSEAGGRRIKRSIYIDMTSVHFLQADEFKRLRKLQLITAYIENKKKEVEADNLAKGIDPGSPANGRNLTNLGTFRAYMLTYLRSHAKIRQDMTLLVRQLQPTEHGIPIEIYCFSADTAWANYEAIQADLFDHILAVVPEFGLCVYQQPSGADLLQLRPPA